MIAQISNRFYKNQVLKTSELLHIFGTCHAVPDEMATRNLRGWKASLSRKYVDIPRITEWNFMVVECVTEHRGPDRVCTDVVLKVKRSVT